MVHYLKNILVEQSPALEQPLLHGRMRVDHSLQFGVNRICKRPVLLIIKVLALQWVGRSLDWFIIKVYSEPLLQLPPQFSNPLFIFPAHISILLNSLVERTQITSDISRSDTCSPKFSGRTLSVIQTPGRMVSSPSYCRCVGLIRHIGFHPRCCDTVPMAMLLRFIVADRKHQKKSPFARNLKRVLQERGVSQRAAEMAGIATSTMNDWAAGGVVPSDHLAVQRLCKALKTDFEWLLTGNTSPRESKDITLAEVFETEEMPSFTGIFEISMRRLKKRVRPE